MLEDVRVKKDIEEVKDVSLKLCKNHDIKTFKVQTKRHDKQFNMSSDDFCTALLRAKKVAVVPGTAFGDCGEGFVRISYAYSIDNLKEALGRIEEFISELRSR